MPLKHLQHVQHPLIYFCNIKIKQLQHTSEMSKTLETYIYDIGEGKDRAGRFSRWGGSRRRAALISALGSPRKDLRHYDMCAPAAMAA
jgi:hypothetical protein